MTLPNFLIIGAEKSGTTWLHKTLSRHPDIFLPRTKEIHFFNTRNTNLIEIGHYERGLAWYGDFFKTVSGQKAIGEITPMYLCDPDAPSRIKAHLPEVKLIFMLRNPIKRAYSHYWMAFRKGNVQQSFDEVIAGRAEKIIQRGLYYEQVKRYYDTFGAEQILGFEHGTFFAQLETSLIQLCAFIGVDPQALPLDEETKAKEYGAPKHKSLALYNAMSRTVKTLRKSLFFNSVANSLKNTGIPDKIKAWNTTSEAYPPITDSQTQQLSDYYRANILKLQKTFDLPVDRWLV